MSKEETDLAQLVPHLDIHTTARNDTDVPLSGTIGAGKVHAKLEGKGVEYYMRTLKIKLADSCEIFYNFNTLRYELLVKDSHVVYVQDNIVTNSTPLENDSITEVGDMKLKFTLSEEQEGNIIDPNYGTEKSLVQQSTEEGMPQEDEIESTDEDDGASESDNDSGRGDGIIPSSQEQGNTINPSNSGQVINLSESETCSDNTESELADLKQTLNDSQSEEEQSSKEERSSEEKLSSKEKLSSEEVRPSEEVLPSEEDKDLDPFEIIDMYKLKKNKPPVSLFALTAHAYKSSKKHTMTVREVIDHIESQFPFFVAAGVNFPSSVRNILTNKRYGFKLKPRANKRRYISFEYGTSTDQVLLDEIREFVKQDGIAPPVAKKCDKEDQKESSKDIKQTSSKVTEPHVASKNNDKAKEEPAKNSENTQSDPYDVIDTYTLKQDKPPFPLHVLSAHAIKNAKTSTLSVDAVSEHIITYFPFFKSKEFMQLRILVRQGLSKNKKFVRVSENIYKFNPKKNIEKQLQEDIHQWIGNRGKRQSPNKRGRPSELENVVPTSTKKQKLDISKSVTSTASEMSMISQNTRSRTVPEKPNTSTIKHLMGELLESQTRKDCTELVENLKIQVEGNIRLHLFNPLHFPLSLSFEESLPKVVNQLPKDFVSKLSSSIENSYLTGNIEISEIVLKAFGVHI